MEIGASKYDVQKINHMYGCSEPLRNSFSCDFTELNWGGFVNQPIDNKECFKIFKKSKKIHLNYGNLKCIKDLAEEMNQIRWYQYDARSNHVVGDMSYDGEGAVPKTRKLNFPE